MAGKRQPTALVQANGKKHLTEAEIDQRLDQEGGRMIKAKKPGGTAGKGGVNPASVADDQMVRIAAEQLTMVPIDDLIPYANNAKKHSPKQINQIRASLREFGFVTPVLIDFDNNIIAGHGRVEAARAEGMNEVPCVLVTNLTDAQRKAYILADNRPSETAAWDTELLKIELEGLEALDFDTGIAGFDVESLAEIETNAYAQAAPENVAEPEGKHFWGDEEGETSEEYEAFTEKFKAKKTTDDCFTPEIVYAAVRDWAVSHYKLGDAQIFRPFYLGGDYEHENYPEGCVVIDNPPFSILSQICRFYDEHSIRYFLFAPTLTLFSTNAGKSNYVPVAASVTYENGARVNTSFVTNLGGYRVEISGELFSLIDEADKRNRGGSRIELPEYIYPRNVLCVQDFDLAKHGQSLCFSNEDLRFTRALDAQKEKGKAIFGGGFFLSEFAASKKAEAEEAALEVMSARLTAISESQQNSLMSSDGKIIWLLSERERALVKSLGKHDGAV